ncbi:MAG: N-sulfoglucosamine sulfohydrolase [Psychromonas sp.]|jgi:N-sulfoglucosamine sulfohydrolase
MTLLPSAINALNSNNAVFNNTIAQKGRDISWIFLSWVLLSIVTCILLPNALAANIKISSPNSPTKKPNILWIISDDHSQMIGAYGDEYATTPNIDALAKKGTLYNNAFSNAPVCSAARATLITGMYPNSLGTQNMRTLVKTPDNVTYFPVYLKQAGYYTANIGKHDYNMLAPKGAWSERLTDKLLQNWDRSQYFKTTKGKKPFFAIMNLINTHESRVGTSMSGKKRNPADIKHSVENAPLPDYFPNTLGIKQTIAQYYDNVSEVDSAIGNILQTLVDDGIADNTLVFFFADHGTGIARSKRWPYNSGLQVPFISFIPNGLKSKYPADLPAVNNEMISFVDFAPTILSLANVAIPSYMQGRIFLGDNKQPAPKYTFGFRDRMDERFELVRTARDERFQYMRNYLPDLPYAQYINTQYRLQPVMPDWHKALATGKLNMAQSHWFLKKPVEELYDLNSDPFEIHNLAEDPAYKHDLLRLRKATQQWLTKIKDVGFLTEFEHNTRAEKHAIYDLARDGKTYPFTEVFNAAQLASFADGKSQNDIDALLNNLKDDDPAVRYWATIGVSRLTQSETARITKKAVISMLISELEKALLDTSPIVRIQAAKALCQLNNCDLSLPILLKELKSSRGAAQLMAINVIDHLDEQARPIAGQLKTLAINLAKKATRSSPPSNAKNGDESKILNNMYGEYVKRVLTKTLDDLNHTYSFETSFKAPLEK